MIHAPNAINVTSHIYPIAEYVQTIFDSDDVNRECWKIVQRKREGERENEKKKINQIYPGEYV